MNKTILPLSTRLSYLCLQSQIPRHILEKDYVLSWALAGIAQVKELQEHLIFKGGTCLKKCYFGEYRFSEDLDFSTDGSGPSGKRLESLMYEATARANELLVSAVGNAEVICAPYRENNPHPKGQAAFVMKARLPYQREHLVRVLVEITMAEKVIGFVERRRIIHSYGETIEAAINSYSLNEIIAEKICATISNAKKLQEKSWHRSRARDYYDLWRIFKDFDHEIQKDTLVQLVQNKTLLRGLVFTDTQDLFQLDYIQAIKRTWHEWLGPLVPNLLDADIVLNELHSLIEASPLGSGVQNLT